MDEYPDIDDPNGYEVNHNVMDFQVYKDNGVSRKLRYMTDLCMTTLQAILYIEKARINKNYENILQIGKTKIEPKKKQRAPVDSSAALE